MRMIEQCEAVATTLRSEYGYDTVVLRRALETRLLYLPEKPRTVTIRTFPVSVSDQERIEYDARVLAYNESFSGAATEPERDQVLITNEYRLMMGRPAVVRVDMLVISSRKHCEEMGRLGYFGHFSPVPERRDPMMRMRLEGYRGMPVSENCHRGAGDPRSAHKGWCHSSGHHRNLLQAFWTDMGTGQSGRLWTQNFGRTKRLAEGTPPGEHGSTPAGRPGGR
jgi:uncharacterized protein YkwD